VGKLLVSIITVTYNSQATIADTIRSVALQSYSNIEHVIIDGSSTDDTLEIVRNTPGRITRIISEPDKGIYDALNKGIINSGGDIIGLLHSDDELASDTIIEDICNKFIQTSSDIVYGDLIYVSNKNKNKIIRYWKSTPFDKALVNKGWMPAHPTVFIRREVYNKYGQFNLRYKISSDYDFILRLMQIRDLKIEYLPRIITKMRMGGVSNSSFGNIFLKSLEDYRIIKKNGLPYPMAILIRKNLSKIIQFVTKEQNEEILDGEINN
jgi:glycosyltransferase